MITNPFKSTESAQQLDLDQLARESAYDRYIQAALVRPKSLRKDFITLAAFHGEMARIPLLVSEPMIGEIRLQWWHDTLAATAYLSDGDEPNFGSLIANHVVHVIQRYPETRELFLAAIDARRAELDPSALAESDALEAHLDGIGGGLFKVASICLASPDDDVHRTALQNAGRAVAASELAQRLGQLLARGRQVAVPDLRRRQDAEKKPKSVTDYTLCIQSLSAVALRAVEAYRRLQGQVSPKLIAAVLPIALVEPQFRALQNVRQGQVILKQPLTPMGRLVRLWWAARRGRI